MNTIYENNLKALKQKNEKLWEAFYTYAKQQKESRAFTAVAKNGEVIIGYHGKDRDFNLNSTYNPSKEAEKLMAEYDTIPDNAFLCMYGLANGIFAKRFLECNPHGNAIYVYEPDLDIFMTAMQEIDLTELLNNNRFFIAVESLNTDDFGDFLLSYISEINELTNRYMALPIYQTRFPEGYDRYKQIIKDKYEYYRIQTNTLIKVGKQIGLASISNMRFLPNCRSGADYKDYFPEDVPAIIVAAGPSLQKNVDLLKKAKGKAITIEQRIKEFYGRRTCGCIFSCRCYCKYSRVGYGKTKKSGVLFYGFWNMEPDVFGCRKFTWRDFCGRISCAGCNGACDRLGI